MTSRARAHPTPHSVYEEHPGLRVLQTATGTEGAIWLVLLLLAGMFTVALAMFSGQHLFILLGNRTQVEAVVTMPSGRSRWIFNVGRRANWTQVMGDAWWEWFLPIPHRGGPDGLTFPNSAGTASSSTPSNPALEAAAATEGTGLLDPSDGPDRVERLA